MDFILKCQRIQEKSTVKLINPFYALILNLKELTVIYLFIMIT